MNEHFEDARHHVERAAKNVREGLEREVEELEERARTLLGTEEPEPGKLEKLQQDLRDLEKKAEGETRDALKAARERIDDYRKSE